VGSSSLLGHVRVCSKLSCGENGTENCAECGECADSEEVVPEKGLGESVGEEFCHDEAGRLLSLMSSCSSACNYENKLIVRWSTNLERIIRQIEDKIVLVAEIC
jgi:hypothetical protein